MLEATEFRKRLVHALKQHQTIQHPILMELLQPRRNWELLRLISTQTYKLTTMFERYVAALLYHCPLHHFRARLAQNVYEEVTGALSGTDGHLELMERFMAAIGLPREQLLAAPTLPATADLIEYRRALVEDPSQYHRAAAAIMVASEAQTIQRVDGHLPHLMMAELYGLTLDDVKFFTLHAEEDVAHVKDGLDLVVELCVDARMQDEAEEAIVTTCRKFWSHYDGLAGAYRAAIDASSGQNEEAAGAARADAAVSWRWLDGIEAERIGAMIDLVERVLVHDDTVGWPGPISRDEAAAYLRELDGAIRRRAAHVLVAEVGGATVGMLVLTPASAPNNAHLGWISKTMVEPSSRGMGVVSRGIATFAQRCEELGIQGLCLDVRAGAPAEQIWRHLGFREFGRLDDYARLRGTAWPGVYLFQEVATLKRHGAADPS